MTLASSSSATSAPNKAESTLTGKVVLITGGSSGLGKQAAFELAALYPAQIWLTGRNLRTLKNVAAQLGTHCPDTVITPLQLDLSSFSSIRSTISAFQASTDRLDVLMLNAGIMNPEYGCTEDGYELQFGTNYLGHALMVKLLLDTLLDTVQKPDADVRVVVLSSALHKQAPSSGISFPTLKSDGRALSKTSLYGQSKVAATLLARELARRYPQITVVSVHPGAVNTNLSSTMTNSSLFMRILFTIGSFFMSNVEEGVKNQVWAVTAKHIANGEYYEPIGVSGRGSKHTINNELAIKLWDWTEAELRE